MSNILVLTPLYPSPGSPQTATAVVHYFTKEWVKQNNVIVLHYGVNYPPILLFLLRFFKKAIVSRVGYDVATQTLTDRSFVIDGVSVHRFMLKKTFPHSLFSKKQVEQAYTKSIKLLCDINFTPDIIISHWPNPQLEIMSMLKEKYNVRTCYVCHGATECDVYKERTISLLRRVDVIGYRSKYIKTVFEQKYQVSQPSFYCYSGIPKSFQGDRIEKNLSKIYSFIFVGNLIQRKYPFEILCALKETYCSENFELTYIGEGKESKKIETYARNNHLEGRVSMMGRIERSEVAGQLNKHQVFVMISKNETFGLVYLEAMSRGCITIASKNEGFDGIIVDGENGFLCEAGNIAELASTITRIRNLSENELRLISQKAIQTAIKMTDSQVASDYLNNVLSN